jgi:hypothetical protein
MPFASKSNRNYDNDDNRKSSSTFGKKKAFGGNGGGGKPQYSGRKPKYTNILTAFANDKGGWLSINFKPTRDIQDIMTKEEFLFAMSALYDGEYIMKVSLFESDIPQADYTGGYRVSEEELEEIKQAANAGKKPKVANKAKAKPQYKIEEEEVAEEESTYEAAEEDEENLPY